MDFSKTTALSHDGASKQPLRPVSSRNSDHSQTSNTDGTKEINKKIPPIKAPVGLARSPDLKSCKSKIGSLNNIKHTPAGGSVSIQTQKLNWNAKSKVGSLDNKEHKPGGGNLKVESRKLEWKTTSKVQSLQNIKHKPGGGKVKIFNESYRDKTNSSQGDQAVSKGSNNNTSNSKDTSNTPESLAKNLKEISLIDKK